MNLSSLKPAKGSTKTRKRVGRGEGSGLGGTSARGNNGAQSRSGYSRKSGFEGGQMPLQRRVPKFGFKNINRIDYKAINLDSLQELADKTGSLVINHETLYTNGLISKKDLVKILNRGEVKSALEVHANGFSASAKSTIEAAGGKVFVVERHKSVEKITE
jgi:large subunit ribosomal protein L15